MPTFNIKNPDVLKNCMIEVSRSMGMEVVIRKPKRSLRQNDYYWALVDIAKNFYGHADKDDMHFDFACEFLPIKEKVFGNRTMLWPKSTTDLSVPEFNAFLENVAAKMIGDGLVIPAPSYYGLD